MTVVVMADKSASRSKTYTKFEKRKSRRANTAEKWCGLTLGTHRLSPDLRTKDATNTDECVTVPGRIYIRMSDPHACPVIVCAEGCSMNVQECLCRRARYTVCSMGPYQCESMLASCCDGLRRVYYATAAALTPHAMPCMSEYTCMSETDRVYHVDTT